MIKLYLFACAYILIAGQLSFGAVLCILDHPDRDVKRLVPEATTYKVRELVPFRHGKKGLMSAIAKSIGTPLDSEYETSDTPYTFYAIYKDIERAPTARSFIKEQIALIVGNNVRAVGGPMQTFVVYDRKGHILDVYVQKISSTDATAFRSKYYRTQFRKFDINSAIEDAEVKPPVRSPTAETIKNHQAFVRAVRFNALIVKHLYNSFSE